MKWYKKEKHWENYKGEVFEGKMSKDLVLNDSFEEIDDKGKKRVLTVIEKNETPEGTFVVMEGVEVNG